MIDKSLQGANQETIAVVIIFIFACHEIIFIIEYLIQTNNSEGGITKAGTTGEKYIDSYFSFLAERSNGVRFMTLFNKVA